MGRKRGLDEMTHMKKKNVMLLIPSMGVGGSERSVSNISKLLSERYRVFVTVFNGKHATLPVSGQLVDLRQPARAGWLKPFVAILRILALRRAVRTHQIDILLGFTLVGCRYLRFAPKSAKRVLCNRGFEETVEKEALYIRMLQQCDGLLFNSYASKEWFTARHPELSKKVFIIQNCFDIDEIERKAKEQPAQEFEQFCKGRSVIVSVGRLCDVKGFDFLIKAFLLLLSDMPNAGLVIVGDGPSMQKLRKLAKAGGDNILFMGLQENPFPYVAASDLYVLPSRAEGFPNALVEAMACGVPVIAANCDTGPNEILNASYDPILHVTAVYKAQYGILVPPVTTAANDQAERLELAHDYLAQAMKTMLGDKSLYKTYQEAAKARAKQFSLDQSFRQYQAFMDQLLGEEDE